MFDQRWRRTVALMLLGMGIFFLNAALLALAVWLSTGSWRPFLNEIVLVAALVTIPAAYHVWNSLAIDNL